MRFAFVHITKLSFYTLSSVLSVLALLQIFCLLDVAFSLVFMASHSTLPGM